MGMSASQARMIQLKARKSNLEYQGQQINQERSILSQQCTDLYNSLLTMKVPTPPSTQDFTTVQYAGVDNASNFILGSIIPTGNTYQIEMKYKKTGHFLEEKGTASVTEIPAKISIQQVDTPVQKSEIITHNEIPQSKGTAIAENDTVPNGTWVMHILGTGENPESSDTCYILKDGNFVPVDKSSNDWTEAAEKYVLRQANTTEGTSGGSALSNWSVGDYTFNAKPEPWDESVTKEKGFTKADLLTGDYVAVKGNSVVRITSNNLESYLRKNDEGFYEPMGNVTIATMVDADSNGVTYDNPDATDGAGIYVEGKKCYSLSEAMSNGRISSDSYKNYIEAIKDAYPEFCDKDTKEIESHFLVYFTKNDSGLQVPHFVQQNEAKDAGAKKQFVTTMDYIANGTYTSTITQDECKLEFDTSGRIAKIGIPKYDDKNNLTGYKYVDLEATKVTDEKAYQDAYAKYEYAMYEYDKAQQEINAKTEIIQQEDRNLELKLTRLDNERKQIDAEYDAVKKVVEDNIDKSYKTFSG